MRANSARGRARSLARRGRNIKQGKNRPHVQLRELRLHSYSSGHNELSQSLSRTGTPSTCRHQAALFATGKDFSASRLRCLTTRGFNGGAAITGDYRNAC
jgi:hypothetical protein